GKLFYEAWNILFGCSSELCQIRTQLFVVTIKAALPPGELERKLRQQPLYPLGLRSRLLRNAYPVTVSVTRHTAVGEPDSDERQPLIHGHLQGACLAQHDLTSFEVTERSEERRVGKECSAWWWVVWYKM